MKKILIFIFLLFPVLADADDFGNLTARRDELKRQISEIDVQLKSCKNEKTWWTVAAVAGTVGAIGTGIGAIVQNNQINTKQDKLKDLQ